jgi:hypothetical protein
MGGHFYIINKNTQKSEVYFEIILQIIEMFHNVDTFITFITFIFEAKLISHLFFTYF